MTEVESYFEEQRASIEQMRPIIEQMRREQEENFPHVIEVIGREPDESGANEGAALLDGDFWFSLDEGRLLLVCAVERTDGEVACFTKPVDEMLEQNLNAPDDYDEEVWLLLIPLLKGAIATMERRLAEGGRG